jgi:hypothetical protein
MNIEIQGFDWFYLHLHIMESLSGCFSNHTCWPYHNDLIYQQLRSFNCIQMDHLYLLNLFCLFSSGMLPNHYRSIFAQFLSFFQVLAQMTFSFVEFFFRIVFNINPIFDLLFLLLLAFWFNNYELFFSYTIKLTFSFTSKN